MYTLPGLYKIYIAQTWDNAYFRAGWEFLFLLVTGCLNGDTRRSRKRFACLHVAEYSQVPVKKTSEVNAKC